MLLICWQMPDHMVTLAWHTRPHKIRSQIRELTCEAWHAYFRRGLGANVGIFLGMDLWSISPLYIMKPVRTPVAILGPLGVCIYVPASRHWLISYSPIHLI